MGPRANRISERLSTLIERVNATAVANKVPKALADFAGAENKGEALQTIRQNEAELGPVKFNDPDHVDIIAIAANTIAEYYLGDPK
eukprot:233769-Pyramimonas_sp.AAC.1